VLEASWWMATSARNRHGSKRKGSGLPLTLAIGVPRSDTTTTFDAGGIPIRSENLDCRSHLASFPADVNLWMPIEGAPL